MEEIMYVQENRLSVSMNNMHDNKYQRIVQQGLMSQSLNGMQNARFFNSQETSSSAPAVQQQQQQQQYSDTKFFTASSMNNIHDDKYQRIVQQGMMSQSLNGIQNARFNIQETSSSSAAAVQQQRRQQDRDSNFFTVSSTSIGLNNDHRTAMRDRGERMEVQQEQIIDQQSMINNSMQVLMESMKQSAVSRKLIKEFPIPFTKKEQELMACTLSSSSTNKTQAVVGMETKRYSNQQKKYNTNKTTQLSVSALLKRTNPFSTYRTTPTPNNNNQIPFGTTIIRPDNYESSSSDSSEALYAQQAQAQHCNNTTTHPHDNTYDNNNNNNDNDNDDDDNDCYSISRPFFDDDAISCTSSILYDDMASLSSSSNSTDDEVCYYENSWLCRSSAE